MRAGIHTPMFSASVVVFTSPLMLFLNLVGWSTGLRMTNMTAPMVQDLREDMDLVCEFDMGAEELYSVKWYKGDDEFYSYTPSRNPPTVTFPVAGVKVVLSKSECGQDHCRVRLTDLKRDFSGGPYKCEISSEAPAFRLASETHTVTIAALPKETPKIEGLAKSYTEGETVSVKCTSAPADPAPILSFYINKKQAPSKQVSDMMSSEPDSIGLVSRTITLRFPAERKFAQGDTFILQCVSTLPGIPFEPQTTTEIAQFKPLPPPQIINNQKLHWHKSTANKEYPKYHQLFLFLLVFIANGFSV